MNKTILPILKSKIPNFIQQAYPNAYKLIIDFYTWLERNDNFIHALLHYSDRMEVNNEINPYIDLIIKELGWNHATLIDLKLLVHILRDFYLSKGSEKSFKLLYRLLYNADVEIRYKRDLFFNLSDSSYSTDQWIFTTGTTVQSVQFQNIYNNSLLNSVVVGQSSRLRSTISKIIPINIHGTHYYKILINNVKRSFIPNEIITISNETNTINETILNYPVIKIIESGYGYKVGERIKISGFTINGYITIGSLTSGGITDISIISGGTGYSIGDSIKTKPSVKGHSFYAEVSNVNNVGAITGIKVWSAGYEFDQFPGFFINSSSGGRDAVLKGISKDVGGIKSFHIHDQYWGQNSNNITTVVETVSGHGVNLNIKLQNCVYETPLTHDNSDKFLGYGGYVFDGDKYQKYAYEIQSSVSNHRLDKIVNDLLHPVGFNKFKVHIIENVIQLNTVGGDSISTKNKVFVLPVIDYTNKNSELNIEVLNYSVNDELSFDINNIEYLKFNEQFKYTISDFGNISFNTLYTLKFRNDKTMDPEITKIIV